MRRFLLVLIFFSTSLFADNTNQYYNSLHQTIMCGYQGWFTCPGDGSQAGWTHWGKSSTLFEPGNCTVDLWPDTSEYSSSELYPTPFTYPDGTTAYVFSSYNEQTVIRHFSWMSQYGIDGIFLQRFATETTPNTKRLAIRDKVLESCRKGANQYKRGWAVMYDLSGLDQGGTKRVIADWKHLVDDFNITGDKSDRAYIYHNGAPVVSLWGIGFSGNRKYTLKECGELIDFFKNDPDYGNCTVIIGIPSYWQRGGGDSTNDSASFEVLKKADILSPWSVGRFGSDNLSDLENYVENVWKKDIQWCQENNKEYLPVIFPGFSWYNMHNGERKLNQIPRQKGNFLWRQACMAKEAGATMLYQAMFDEVDEATAIFKCTNTPPDGKSKFCSYENLPSDYYLKLCGEIRKMLRNEIPQTKTTPVKH